MTDCAVRVALSPQNMLRCDTLSSTVNEFDIRSYGHVQVRNGEEQARKDSECAFLVHVTHLLLAYILLCL